MASTEKPNQTARSANVANSDKPASKTKLHVEKKAKSVPKTAAKMPVPAMLDLGSLAERSGMSEAELRIGAAAFFRKLTMSKPKLLGAMVSASSASGATPDKFLKMLDLLASDMDVDGSARPVTSDIRARVSNVAEKVSTNTRTFVDRVVENEQVSEISDKLQETGEKVKDIANGDRVQGVMDKVSDLAEKAKINIRKRF